MITRRLTLKHPATAGRSPTDGFTISDSVTRSVARPRPASDSFAISDTATRAVIGFARTLSDSIASITDSA